MSGRDVSDCTSFKFVYDSKDKISNLKYMHSYAVSIDYVFFLPTNIAYL